MMASLASSAGWKESAPRRIQRWVSFTGAQEEHQDQQQGGAADRRVDHGRLAQLAVVEAHGRHHRHQAQARPHHLADEEVVGVAVVLLGQGGGRAPDHHQAQPQQGHASPRRARSREASFLAIARSASGGSGQPPHLVLEGAPALRVVAEHVERRAGGREQHRVARLRARPGALHRLAQARAGDHGHRRRRARATSARAPRRWPSPRGRGARSAGARSAKSPPL